jgi:hypothetical protein
MGPAQVRNECVSRSTETDSTLTYTITLKDKGLRPDSLSHWYSIQLTRSIREAGPHCQLQFYALGTLMLMTGWNKEIRGQPMNVSILVLDDNAAVRDGHEIRKRSLRNDLKRLSRQKEPTEHYAKTSHHPHSREYSDSWAWMFGCRTCGDNRNDVGRQGLSD